jgi:hypothetical protein
MELHESRKKRARLFWTIEKERYDTSNVPNSKRPARVVNYDEDAYLLLVLQREKVYLRNFQPTKEGMEVELDPLPELPPLDMNSPRSLQLQYMHYCDEVLRRSVDPLGKPLKFDSEHSLKRILAEYNAFGVYTGCPPWFC